MDDVIFSQVHDAKIADDEEDPEERALINQRALDRSKFEYLLKDQGFTIQRSQIDGFVYTKLFCPFKRLCKEAELVKMEMPIKGVTFFHYF